MATQPQPRIVVFQHMPHETPGLFLDVMAAHGISAHPVHLHDGEAIPALDGFDAMMAMGGAQQVWQEDDYPWLVEEKAAIRDWVLTRGKPYYGVCLGHQLLASALGGEVGPAGTKEIGILDVALNGEGRAHPFLSALPDALSWLQWHTAEVHKAPPGARVLASSRDCPIQAIAVGTHALGTQFHAEASLASLESWAERPDYLAALAAECGPDGYGRLLADARTKMPAIAAHARHLFENFLATAGLARSAPRPAG